jgi:hypothetical protein
VSAVQRRLQRALAGLSALLGLAAASSGFAADAEADALALPGVAPDDAKPEANQPLKLSLEAAVGQGTRRFVPGDETLKRLSLDLVYSTRLGSSWRAVLSNRLDALDPREGDSVVNSLREAYVGWQEPSAQWVVEAGRINPRSGPAFGYNPTDFFRDGSLRVATTVDPLLVREYRMGSVMLRAQRLWSEGSLSLAVSPKLADRPSAEGFSLDLGATNNRSRALLTLSAQASAQTSFQLHAYAEDGKRGQLGASVSSLFGDATVAFAEAAVGRDVALLDRVQGRDRLRTEARAAAGLTYTTANKLSIIGELEYNGFAADASQWQAAAAAGPVVRGAYLREADRSQDLAARSALMLYAKQTSAIWRDLDLTAMMRRNWIDHSTLTWVEARYHLGNWDLSAQALQYRGRGPTEFGLTPYRRTWQLLLTYYL